MSTSPRQFGFYRFLRTLGLPIEPWQKRAALDMLTKGRRMRTCCEPVAPIGPPASPCSDELLAGYLSDSLELDDQLTFLLHVDGCYECRKKVYAAKDAEMKRNPTWWKRGKVVEVEEVEGVL